MTELKFYICEHCGNLIELVKDGGVPMMCCGKKMTKLEPGAVDASEEKHVPILAEDGDTLRVDVGAVTHPMLPEHHIAWVALLTDKGYYRKALNPGDEPVALFKRSHLDAALFGCIPQLLVGICRDSHPDGSLVDFICAIEEFLVLFIGGDVYDCSFKI